MSVFFFFKQKTAYEMLRSLVGSEMCIRDSMVTGRGGSGGMDQRTSEQRYMGIMHKSDKRVQCVRLPTHQPCFHKFESWGASTAKCASWNITLQEEMVLGRYC
eukprot:TRINITY_DN31764_c0_g1_i3.p1 TRINITY_DN31764_c0_g1~~TRINITY_DN31764_c0_g1_i3.p1  ORF type:complete len:103 (+),score=30.11 TRINITY_DN31764_c0_g1_i3:81-389(+)